MIKYFPNVLLTLVFFLFAIEGLGLQSGRQITYFTSMILSITLFIHLVIHKKKVIIPRNATILWVLFLITTYISAFLGVNRILSLSYLIQIITIFLFFLLFYNYKEILAKQVPFLIFSLSILFCIYSFLLSSKIINLFIPVNGYQFVYASFSSHNHLGDFLLLPIIYCLYSLYSGKALKFALVSLIIILPFFLISFSRSAYLSLVLALFCTHIYFSSNKIVYLPKWVMRLLLIIFITLSFTFLLIVTRQSNHTTLSYKTFEYLSQEDKLINNRELFKERLGYINQAITTIQKYTLFGIGPNNFLYASSLKKVGPSLGDTNSAHNIFLEILVGQGIIGFIPFLILIIYFLIKSKKNVLYFLFIGILFNFQTDYTYQIYTFFLLFFILVAVNIKDKDVYIKQLISQYIKTKYGRIKK